LAMIAVPVLYGVAAAPGRAGEEWEQKGSHVEWMGYATLLMPEGLQHSLAPLPALTAAAMATRTLRVGTYGIANDYRNPVMLAKEAATLDVLSGGRFELGLGAGWLRAEYEQAGMAFESAGVRVSRLEEAIQVLKGLWADELLTFSGNHYTVTNLN